MPDTRDDAAAKEAAPHPIHDLIEEWFASRFHNSIVSRDTETLNHVRTAVDELKAALAAAVPAAAFTG